MNDFVQKLTFNPGSPATGSGPIQNIFNIKPVLSNIIKTSPVTADNIRELRSEGQNVMADLVAKMRELVELKKKRQSELKEAKLVSR